MERNDNQGRCEPSPRPRFPRRAQTCTVGIRGGVLEKGGKGGGGDGGRHALLEAARVRKDKAREGWHHSSGRGREKGKCVAKGHLPHGGHGCRKERAAGLSELQREVKRNVAPAVKERRGGSLSLTRQAETPG